MRPAPNSQVGMRPRQSTTVNRSDSARRHHSASCRAAAGTKHPQWRDGAAASALTWQDFEQWTRSVYRRRSATLVLGVPQEPLPPLAEDRRWTRPPVAGAACSTRDPVAAEEIATLRARAPTR